MIRSYPPAYYHDFPDSEIVLKDMEPGDIAVIKDRSTEYEYVLTKGLGGWARLSGLVDSALKDVIDDTDSDTETSCKFCEETDRAKVYAVRVTYEYENPKAYGYPDVAYWHKMYDIRNCPFCGRKIGKEN